MLCMSCFFVFLQRETKSLDMASFLRLGFGPNGLP